ncbi:MAG: aldehyde dehydrogenase family protein [Erysipelotrichaceae bacterium]
MIEIVKNANRLKQQFKTNITLDVEYRIKLLKKLKEILELNEEKLLDALKCDLNKGYYEGYMCELSLIFSELNHAIKNTRKWSKGKKSLSVFPVIGSFNLKYYPKGLVLIMVPFNYPMLLSLVPLINALSAGNVAMLRFSESVSTVAKCLQEIFQESLVASNVDIIIGNRNNKNQLFEVKYDHIFFTGSSGTGKFIMAKAAETLTPVTLELGGKSPCIVNTKENLEVVAKRILFGKLINAGQTCVAPDYLVVKSEIVDDLIMMMNKLKNQMVSELTDDDWPKIIDYKNFKRLKKYLEDAKIVFGGKADELNLKMELTLIIPNDLSHISLKEEIFGPVLPLLPYSNEKELFHILNQNPDPLALYIFSNNDKFVNKILSKVSFGTASINDTLMQITSNKFPFGGRGNSGLGNYHGNYGFETFSHSATILKRKLGFDFKQRFKPYPKDYNEIKKYMKGR